MKLSTEELIRELVTDLKPVERLPRLREMTLRTLALVCVMLGAAGLFQTIGGMPLIKSDLGLVDFLGIAGHLTLAAGALTLALATCIPGREVLERAGWLGMAVGAGMTFGALLGFYPASSSGVVDAMWLRGTMGCLLIASVPALVPAALLSQFAARGVPRRPLRTLTYGSIAALGFMSLPGHLGCPSADLLHNLLAHNFAPVTGGLLVLAATTASFVKPRNAH